MEALAIIIVLVVAIIFVVTWFGVASAMPWRNLTSWRIPLALRAQLERWDDTMLPGR
jgi:hypothetical protein